MSLFFRVPACDLRETAKLPDTDLCSALGAGRLHQTPARALRLPFSGFATRLSFFFVLFSFCSGGRKKMPARTGADSSRNGRYLFDGFYNRKKQILYRAERGDKDHPGEEAL